MNNDATFPSGALPDDELDAIVGGAGRPTGNVTRAQQNQMLVDLFASRGLSVDLEMVADAATLMDIGRNPDKYRGG